MSTEIFNDVSEEKRKIFDQPDFRMPSVDEIFNRKKKKRRARFPRRLLKKWLQEREKQNILRPLPFRGTIPFSIRSPAETGRKIA